MAEQTAIRKEKKRSKEDTIHIWTQKLLSKLSLTKAPDHQIIEVPLPAGAGGTESLNGCILTPPPAAVTAATASHPHLGNDPALAQSEQPVPKSPTNSHWSPTDRHRASEPTLDQTPQQGPAKDGCATQNGDEARILQSTYSREKEKGKAIAQGTNDAGLPSINVSVSANIATAQCDSNVPARHACPVKNIPYSKTFTERLSKAENLYIDRREEIAPATNNRWKNEIQRELDKDLRVLNKAKFGARDNILSFAQLYMVGIKHKGTLAVEPTIIITCGTMESKKWITEELGKLKLHYLDDFGCPWRVRYKPKPASWAASPPDETPSTPSGTNGYDIPNLQGVYIEQSVKPGLSGLKLRFDLLQDGITQHRYATLGGIISINEANLLMTTAHPFLTEFDSGNGPLVSDDMEASIADSDSDSGSQSDAEIAEPPNVPRTSLPFDQMHYSLLWTSEQWTPVAYSFLGRISLSNAGNAVKIQWPSSSDWALFQAEKLSLLPESQIHPQYSSFIPEDRLTPGEVKIIDTVDALSAGFLTQTAASIYTAEAVVHVREIMLSGVLSSGASGAWVIRGSEVCGYVVATTGSGKSCFMVPMYCAFEEIEVATGAKPKLGVEQLDTLNEDAIGASYDSEMESASDDHRPADSTRSSYETPRSNNPTSVPATESSKAPRMHASTRKPVTRRPLTWSSDTWSSDTWSPDTWEPASVPRLEPRGYGRFTVLNREAGLQSASRSHADSRDPHETEMIIMTEVADTAIESLPIDRVDERSKPTIPKSRQEDVVDNRVYATNWSTRKKYRNFLVILTLTFITTLASTVVAPGVPLIMHEFGVNNVLGAFVVSIFVLGQITGPHLIAPLSDSYGRLIIYHFGNLSFIIWNVACALAPNAGALLIFRFFAGTAAAGPLTIGRSSVEDMFSTEKRYHRIRLLGYTTNVFHTHRDIPLVLIFIVSMLGPCIGPVFGGYLVEKEGWRWAFWLLTIAGGLVTITAMVVMSETRVWVPSIGELSKPHNLRRWFILGARHPLNIKKPFKSLHLSWAVLAPVVHSGLMKGYPYILYTTLTPVFTAMYTSVPNGHLILGLGSAGLTFLTAFLGTIFGGLAGCHVFVHRRGRLLLTVPRSDSSVWRDILFSLVASGLLTSLGLTAFGWTVLVVKETQIIFPLAASTLAFTGTTLGVLAVENLIPTADAINDSNFLGLLAGGLLPLIAQGFYLLPFGLGWTNTAFGIGALFILERVWYWHKKARRVATDELSRRPVELEERIMTPDHDADREDLGGYSGYRYTM